MARPLGAGKNLCIGFFKLTANTFSGSSQLPTGSRGIPKLGMVAKHGIYVCSAHEQNQTKPKTKAVPRTVHRVWLQDNLQERAPKNPK